MKMSQDHLGKTYPDEKTMCAAYKIAHSTFYQRYHVNNWTLEDALTRPVHSQRPRKRTEKEALPKKAEKNLKTEISEFSVRSNHPHEEYKRFLTHEIEVWLVKKSKEKDARVQKLIDEEISRIKALVRDLLRESFHYKILDMIFAGEQEFAKNLCTQDTFEQCTFLLDNPSGRIKEIYYAFAEQFNMQRRMES